MERFDRPAPITRVRKEVEEGGVVTSSLTLEEEIRHSEHLRQFREKRVAQYFLKLAEQSIELEDDGQLPVAD